MFNGPNSSAGLEAFRSLTFTFRDDRGRSVRPVAATTFRRLFQAAIKAGHRALYRRVENNLSSPAVWFVVILGLSITLVVDGILVYSYRSAYSIPSGTEIPRVVVGILAPFVMATALLIRRAARAADELVLSGLCPGCDYSIAELEPADDGCTVCPECGAAWRTRNERVRLRAYELSESRVKGQGSAEDDWYRAEREFESQLA